MDYGPELHTYKNKTVGVFGGKFYPPHQGHVTAIKTAANKVDVLFVVVQYDEKHERKLSQNTKITHIKPRIRERWLSAEFKNYPNIRVLSHYEKRQDDWDEDSIFLQQTYQELKTLVGGKIDKVFSCVEEYDEYFQLMLPGTPHEVIYNEKTFPINISATKIREKGLFETWEYLLQSTQREHSLNVALCGIESTGKSYLSKSINRKYNLPLVEEYGRTYFEKYFSSYSDIDTEDDYINIALGHSHNISETKLENNKKVNIIDTDIIYTQFFFQESFGYLNKTLDSFILNNLDKIDKRIYIQPHNYHELDGTRLAISEKQREAKNNKLLDLYNHYNKELIIIDNENSEEREKETLEAIDIIIS